MIDRVRKIHDRVRDFLTVACICSYFLSGHRNQAADRLCFRSLQHGVTSVNTVSFLKLLGPSLPRCDEEGALFPSRLAACLGSEGDEGENLCEPFEALAEGFRLLEDYPEEAGNLVSPALDSLGSLFAQIAPLVGGDRIVVKLASAEAVRIFDVLKSTPMILDPRLFANFPLPVEAPILISANSTMSLPLTPFFGVGRERVRLLRIDPDERGLSEFFHRCGAHEGFLGFLGENR